MERKGAAPSLWQRQTLSTKGESDGLSSSKIIISHLLEVTRSGSANPLSMPCSSADPASHDSTNALIPNYQLTPFSRKQLLLSCSSVRHEPQAFKQTTMVKTGNNPFHVQGISLSYRQKLVRPPIIWVVAFMQMMAPIVPGLSL